MLGKSSDTLLNYVPFQKDSKYKLAITVNGKTQEHVSIWKDHLSMYGITIINTMRSWYHTLAWWRHQMETFSTLLAMCAGNSPVPGEFPAQRPVTRSFDVCFDLRLNKRLSKQSRGWWLETQSRPLWRHSNVWWESRTWKYGHKTVLSLWCESPYTSKRVSLYRDAPMHLLTCHYCHLESKHPLNNCEDWNFTFGVMLNEK